MSDNELTVANQGVIEQLKYEQGVFELAQRRAKIYTTSTLVPKEYQGEKSVGNVMIAMNMANRMGADALMVMQNLYIVHGKPGWSAQFLIACFNSCGRFSAIKYRQVGERGKDDFGFVAYATETSTGEEVESEPITIALAKAEGWHGKNGSKWKTMPGQMARYRAATFLIRATAPEIGMGLQTREEIYDSGPTQNGEYDADKPTAQEVVAQFSQVDEMGEVPEQASKIDINAFLDDLEQKFEQCQKTKGIDAMIEEFLGADGPWADDVEMGEEIRKMASKAKARIRNGGDLFNKGNENAAES